MSPQAIQVKELRKCYRAPQPAEGRWRVLKGLLKPAVSEIEAIRNISFDIGQGERVAFIGPNGAGKSTTIKILSGILYPTSGEARVLGAVPWQERARLSYRVGSIFGQRSQLWYHLPPADTFDLLARIYDLAPGVYRQRRNHLVELFSLEDLLTKPVRLLSLGERMRCEIAASLLHAPEVLFLDEPTIGLDVAAKAVIRSLVRQISVETGTTVLLTSHDTGDIEGVCDRVIVINQGALILDAALGALRTTFIKQKLVAVQSTHEKLALSMQGVRIVRAEPFRMVLEIDLSVTGIESVVAALLLQGGIADLTVEDPPLEEIIKQIYAEGAGV